MSAELTISVTDLTPANSPPALEKQSPINDDTDIDVTSPSPELSATEKQQTPTSTQSNETLNNAPLDLSVRTPSLAPPVSSETLLSTPSTTGSSVDDSLESGIQSLNELANLQKRFMGSPEAQNYVNQLHKVANGPTALIDQHPMKLNNNNMSNGINPLLNAPNPSSAPLPSPLAKSYNSSADLKALCQNLPLQYQLAAYSLWSSNYALAMSKAQQIQTPPAAALSAFSPSPVPAITSAMLGINRFRKQDTGDTSPLFPQGKPNSAYPGNPMTLNAPPEAFGISMRGNQKYSAYYQKPFQMPLSSSMVANHHAPKRDSSSAKKASITSVTNDTRQASSSVDSRISLLSDDKSVQRSSETAFVCSCGEEFENLYIFTLHMKESEHHPKTSQNLRSIPKLVRGQDMWINSETEQTREILRCMHCHQSFPTLPDLTMHMIKTNHYSEIVYSDSGRCVLVNSEENKKASSTINESKEKNMSAVGEQLGGSRKSLSPNPSVVDKSSQLNEEDGVPPIKKVKRIEEESIAKVSTTTNQDVTSQVTSAANSPPAVSPLKVNHPSHHNRHLKRTKTEVTEADSATVDSPVDSESINSTSRMQSPAGADVTASTGVSETVTSISTDSVIRQIESFVEKSLPRVSVKVRPIAMRQTNGKYIQHSPTMTSSGKGKSDSQQHSGDRKSDSSRMNSTVPYVAPPDVESRPLENPLSSLQKLVDTTHKSDPLKTRSVSPLINSLCNHTSEDLLKLSKQLSSINTSSAKSSSSTTYSSTATSSSPNLSTLVQPSPTVIMVNPTYIYQPSFQPSLSGSMCPPPWYPQNDATSRPTVDNGTSSPVQKSSGEPTNKSDDEDDETETSKVDAVDLSKIKESSSPSDKPSHDEQQHRHLDTLRILSHSGCATIPTPPGAITTSPSSPQHHHHSSSRPSLHSHHGHPNSSTTASGTIIKKAKCNYCGKPFANKGQVRLHVSKGKCPSLLQQQNMSHASTPLSVISSACSSTGGSLPTRLPPMPPTGLLSAPFGYPQMPLLQDYIEQMAANLMGAAVAAGDLQHFAGGAFPQVTNEERLQLYTALAKQLSGN